jgi:hypothetical protein
MPSEGYLMIVYEFTEKGVRKVVKSIRNLPSQVETRILMSEYKDGVLVKGREYLGEIETNWWPEGRVPFEVTDAFVGARTYSTMTNQLCKST